MNKQKITTATFNEVAHIAGFLNKEEFLHFNARNETRVQRFYQLSGNRQDLKDDIEKKLKENKPLN